MSKKCSHTPRISLKTGSCLSRHGYRKSILAFWLQTEALASHCSAKDWYVRGVLLHISLTSSFPNWAGWSTEWCKPLWLWWNAWQPSCYRLSLGLSVCNWTPWFFGLLAIPSVQTQRCPGRETILPTDETLWISNRATLRSATISCASKCIHRTE